MTPRLEPPFADDMDFYDQVRTDSGSSRDLRALMNAAALQVRSAVTRYPTSLESHNVPVAAGLTKKQGDALKALYKKDRAAKSSVLSQVFFASATSKNDRCPYCGIGWPRQIDHYLPKTSFPELSIAGTNLIPACADCNWLKGEATVAPDGSRYSHAYIDEDFPEPYLCATVVWRNGNLAVRYSLTRSGSMSSVQFSGLRKQFSDLCLLQRYGTEAVKEINDHGYQDLAASALRRRTMKKTAVRMHSRLFEKYGPNHWMTALYAGLARVSFQQGEPLIAPGSIIVPPGPRCQMYFADGVPTEFLA